MEFVKKDFYTMEDLLDIVKRLRDPDTGCEWDRIQTHHTIRKDFIEETYEAVDAIDNEDRELMLEEFGDVMLQVLLHSQMEKEQGSFEFSDVVNSLAQKLVLRHPHVFKGTDIDGVDRVLNQWEKIKNDSHGHTTVSRTLNAVPKSFPALMYTQKVQKRVQAGKLPVPTAKEEIENIRRLLDKIEKSIDETGVCEKDISAVIFSAVNIARQSKMDAEEILGRKSADFVKIFNIFEDLALQKDLVFGTIENATLKEIWLQAEKSLHDEEK